MNNINSLFYGTPAYNIYKEGDDSLIVYPYNRRRAVEYARKWSLDRNPLFINFAGIGGDCTNFVSQCILAGCCQMNFTRDLGWYYISTKDRAAAWTGVDYFYNFITSNSKEGPFGRVVEDRWILPGDVIQLGTDDGDFYHATIVTKIDNHDIYVCAHTDNALDRPLSTYTYDRARYIHIAGARRRNLIPNNCFYDLITGRSVNI